MLLKYFTPFGFLALLPLGAWLGGGWTFMAAAATLVGLVGFDSILGEEPPSRFRGDRRCRWIARAYILLQLAASAWVATLVARPTTSLLEAAGLTLSAGVTTGVFGFVAAHEMIHSRSPRDRALGLLLLASVFYMHFRIAHVYGHHRRAATPNDPATARLGENLYAFLPRSIAGQFAEAWAFEKQRRRNVDRTVIAPGNRMVAYVATDIALLLAVAAISVRAALFMVGAALVAVLLLETFNYVAHYGLRRRLRPNGRPERLAPRHSWNSVRAMNNAALFNMGRHSDHHRRTSRPYAQLRPLAGEPELPSGYAAALLTALVPPLWRRVMDPRVAAGNATGSTRAA